MSVDPMKGSSRPERNEPQGLNALPLDIPASDWMSVLAIIIYLCENIITNSILADVGSIVCLSGQGPLKIDAYRCH